MPTISRARSGAPLANDQFILIGAAALVQLSFRAWQRGGAVRLSAPIASHAIAAHGLRSWARLFRAGPLAAPLYPLSSLVFLAIALNSTLRVALRRGVTWKGRTIR